MNSRKFIINSKRYSGFCYTWNWCSMMILNSIDATLHSHYPVEIYLGLDGPFRIYINGEWHEYNSVLIESNIPHKFDGGRGRQALILIDPVSRPGFNLRRNLLTGKDFCGLDDYDVQKYSGKIADLLSSPSDAFDPEQWFSGFLSSVSVDDGSWPGIDTRIAHILTILGNNPENQYPAADLAQMVGLSESRLAHLFREETGITIRRYLMWLRITKVVTLAARGMSMTNAAHEGGFADSAHFSRTYREIYGLSPAEILRRPGK